MAEVSNMAFGFHTQNQEPPLIICIPHRQMSNAGATLETHSLTLLPWEDKCILKAVCCTVTSAHGVGFWSFWGAAGARPSTPSPTEMWPWCWWPSPCHGVPEGHSTHCWGDGLACVAVATGRWGASAGAAGRQPRQHAGRAAQQQPFQHWQLCSAWPEVVIRLLVLKPN